jgi:hypothetical protein
VLHPEQTYSLILLGREQAAQVVAGLVMVILVEIMQDYFWVLYRNQMHL